MAIEKPIFHQNQPGQPDSRAPLTVLTGGALPEQATTLPSLTPTEYVTMIINKRSEIWEIGDLEGAIRAFEHEMNTTFDVLTPEQVGEVEEGLVPPDPGLDEAKLIQRYKKLALHLYQIGITPPDMIRITPDERNESFKRRLGVLHSALTRDRSSATVLSMGSYAKGKLNNGLSDLDMIVILDASDEGELAKWKSGERLAEAGIHLCEGYQNEQDWEAFRTGEGDLMRLFAADDQYNELEFHVLSLGEAKKIPSHFPGQIRRVRPKASIAELRTSFDGSSRMLPKPPDVVPHHVVHEGKTYRGFFPEAFLTAQRVYDPNNDGERLIERLWYSNMKAFLYHNDAYTQDANGKPNGIKPEFENADIFLETLYAGKRSDLSPHRYSDLLELHRRTLVVIRERLLSGSNNQVVHQKGDIYRSDTANGRGIVFSISPNA